jgi:ribosome recycling factor
MDSISKFNEEAEKILSYLISELKSFRTGKATPALIEDILVETYNGQMKLRLMELAAINTLDNNRLMVKPFDSTILGDIEKAILKTPLGISPRIEGNQIILQFPPLTEEQRLKLIKYLNQIIEDKRNQIRRLRDEARKTIKNQFEEKNITEDERFRLEKQLDEKTKNIMERIEEIKNKKVNEISTL